MLERNAKNFPSRVCCKFADGTSWTYAETLNLTQQTAAYLSNVGVKRADLVLAWLPNSPAMLRVWFALNYIGAVFVPLNLDYRGRILEHVIRETHSRLMLAHPDLIDRLNNIDTSKLETVLAVNGSDGRIGDKITVSGTQLAFGTKMIEPANVNVWDPQMVIFTSGTTGPSKGVLCPYLQMVTVGKGSYGYINERDCILIDLPIFHVGGVSPVMAAITNGATMALYDGFKTQEFWTRIRDTNATTTSGLIGSMAAFLAKAPQQSGEQDNTLRMLTCVLNEQALQVAKRYDFSLCSGFNMSELSVPLVTEIDCQIAGSCGKPRTGCECRVVDEHDYECAPGEVGELIVRTDQPWETSLGYLNRPDATAAAWRNGWFHTGDLVRKDVEGNFFFVDRLKDAVRRRGENVSSLEVESEVLGYDAVAEAAVVGIPSEFGDEDILVAVVAKRGKSVDPQKLIEYLIPLMPHYMVPRFIRTMDELPKTATNKLMKYAIRDNGITYDTWDAEAEGIFLRKTRLSP
jgi:crotonobetaine/carnitine-CoA ligase